MRTTGTTCCRMSVKRSVSNREVAGPTRLKATESFTIDVSMYAHTC